MKGKQKRDLGELKSETRADLSHSWAIVAEYLIQAHHLHGHTDTDTYRLRWPTPKLTEARRHRLRLRHRHRHRHRHRRSREQKRPIDTVDAEML